VATLEAVNFVNWLAGHLVTFIVFVAALCAISGRSVRDLGSWLEKRRTQPRAVKPVASAAGRPALGTAKIARSYRALAQKVLSAGWRIERAGSHHVAWVSPTGTRVLAPSTPRHDPSPRFLAELRRAGLDLVA
jgi:hypothetical protein